MTRPVLNQLTFTDPSPPFPRAVTVAVALTPTQQRIMDVLKDGEHHSEAELRACLSDEQAVESTLSVHLVNIRKRIGGQGLDVVSYRPQGRIGTSHPTTYKLVRLVNDDG